MSESKMLYPPIIAFDDPPTMPYEIVAPKTKHRTEGYTHVFSGIRHTEIMFKGTVSRELRHYYLARFLVKDNACFFRRKTFHNPHGYFCVEWERLIKV